MKYTVTELRKAEIINPIFTVRQQDVAKMVKRLREISNQDGQLEDKISTQQFNYTALTVQQAWEKLTEDEQYNLLSA